MLLATENRLRWWVMMLSTMASCRQTACILGKYCANIQQGCVNAVLANVSYVSVLVELSLCNVCALNPCTSASYNYASVEPEQGTEASWVLADPVATRGARNGKVFKSIGSMYSIE